MTLKEEAQQTINKLYEITDMLEDDKAITQPQVSLVYNYLVAVEKIIGTD